MWQTVRAVMWSNGHVKTGWNAARYAFFFSGEEEGGAEIGTKDVTTSLPCCKIFSESSQLSSLKESCDVISDTVYTVLNHARSTEENYREYPLHIIFLSVEVRTYSSCADMTNKRKDDDQRHAHHWCIFRLYMQSSSLHFKSYRYSEWALVTISNTL